MGPLDNLAQLWADERAERELLDDVIDLEDELEDPESALERLRREEDPEITSPWRAAA